MGNRNIEITILIPCLNEQKTIKSCILKANSFLDKNGFKGQVLVIDNNSTDNSFEIASKCDCKVIRCLKNGYGAALIKGIKNAQTNFCVMGDADLSYNFCDLSTFVDKLKEGSDLVIGNRYKGNMEKGSMPVLHKYIGTPAITGLGNLLYKTKVHDYNCGLRAFNTKKISLLNLQCSGMEFATEMIIKSALAGYNITEVPIDFFKSGRDGKSHLNPVMDGFRHLNCLLSTH